MKNRSGVRRAKAAVYGLAFFAFLIFGSRTNAQILLTIDDSNPSAVTITTTLADPSAVGGNVPGTDGVDLLQFFTTQLTGFQSGVFSPSNLAVSGQSQFPYQNWNIDSYSGSNVDMQMYNQNGSSQRFSTTSPAFTGSETVDLSAFAAYLPQAGSIGQVTDGYSGDASGPLRPLTVMGTWEVTASPVPEPSSYLLFSLGALALSAAGAYRALKPAIRQT